MFELMAVLALVVGGLLVLATVAVIGFVLKVAFKLLLIPFWILGVVLKGVLLIGAVLLALVFAPLLLLLALVILPIAAIAGLFGLGVWAVA